MDSSGHPELDSLVLRGFSHAFAAERKQAFSWSPFCGFKSALATVALRIGAGLTASLLWLGVFESGHSQLQRGAPVEKPRTTSAGAGRAESFPIRLMTGVVSKGVCGRDGRLVPIDSSPGNNRGCRSPRIYWGTL